jgi:hypothetical protein
MSSLTGRRRYRIGGWPRKKLILQVEERTRVWAGPEGIPALLWRDATVEDLMILPANSPPFPIARG